MTTNAYPAMNLYYLFDSLCGWCYGAKPVLSELAKHHPIYLTPTGLFCHSGRIMDKAFGQYAGENDKRIAKMTGVVFSPLYEQNILGQQTVFDSYHSLLAITATQMIAPARATDVLSALQLARYVDGRDNQDWQVIYDVLHQLGLSEISAHLEDAEVKQRLQENIHFGQNLAKRLGLHGVPQLVIEHDGEWMAVPSHALYGDAQALLNYLDADLIVA